MRRERSFSVGAMTVALVGACGSPPTPDSVFEMALAMHARSPAFGAFGGLGRTRDHLNGVPESAALSALDACGARASGWERLPSVDESDRGLHHYWRCERAGVVVVAEVYWGGSLGVPGHTGTDGVRFAACWAAQCPSNAAEAFVTD